MNRFYATLVHASDQFVDELLSVTSITALDEVLELPRSPSSERIAKLEWSQKVTGLLEIGTDGENLVDEILNGDDAEFPEVILDKSVVSERDALPVDFSVTSFVDELSDRLEIGLSVSDVWLNEGQHLRGSLGELYKDTIVDLEQTHKLHDLSGLRWDFVDTLDTDYKGEFWLGWNVEIAVSLGNTLESDLFPLGLTVFLDILLGTFEDDFSLVLGSLIH